MLNGNSRTIQHLFDGAGLPQFDLANETINFAAFEGYMTPH